MKPDWSRVSLEHIRLACEQYDLGTAVPKRDAKSTFLILDGKTYPAKFIRGRAYFLATGIELDPSQDYSGGPETIRFFKGLGLSTRHDLSSKPKEPTTPPTPLPPVEEHPKGSKEHREPQKRALAKILRRRYGTVKIEEEFPWLTVPAPGEMDEAIGSIFDALKQLRGFTDFITPGKSLKCDFFIPDANLIVEYDERQHFTEQRAKALELYQPDLKLAFDREEWITACRAIKATDPDRKYPYRDEQRAFYDSLRDILAVRNGVRLIRLRSGTEDWTRPNVDEQLNNLLTKCQASVPQPVVLPATQASPLATLDQIRKVALISHNYGEYNSYNLQDYSEHFARINSFCDDHGCDTVLYALWTWDQDSPVPLTNASVFGGLCQVQRVLLEHWHKPWNYDYVEIWQRGSQKRKAVQRFERSGDSERRKETFINELPDRMILQALLVLCGESGIIKEKEKGVFIDNFGFLDRLDKLNVRLILNPIHDYMAPNYQNGRPGGVDVREKRRHYSRNRRTVVSVWNQGRRDRNVAAPWTVFHDGQERTQDVVELPRAFNDRLDIRIGIIDVSVL